MSPCSAAFLDKSKSLRGSLVVASWIGIFSGAAFVLVRSLLAVMVESAEYGKQYCTERGRRQIFFTGWDDEQFLNLQKGLL